MRPLTWTSADAAGPPILRGLARYRDLKKGGSNHARPVTANRARKAMGQCLPLKASFDVSHFLRPGARRAPRRESTPRSCGVNVTGLLGQGRA